MGTKVGIDVYFAGSYSEVAEKELYKLEANRLANQLLDKKVITEWIAQRKNGTNVGKLFIDSGAWSAHTQGTTLDVDSYISFLNDNDEHIALFAQADTIPGKYKEPKTREQLLAAPESSWQNYLYMRDRVSSPEKLVPVYHQGEQEKWLVNMLEWVDNTGKHIPYIGVSPANDRTIKDRGLFLERCRDIIDKSSNPDVKTHIFGLMTIKILDHVPATSADSTTWLRAAMYGGIMSDNGVYTLSRRRNFAPEYLFRHPKAVQDAVQKMVEDRGFDWERICLEEDYKYRILYNIHYLMDRQANMLCRTSKVRRRSLL